MFIFFIIFVLPVSAVLSLLLYLPVYLVQRRRGRMVPFIRHLVGYAFIGMIVVLLYLTVFWYGVKITFQPDYYFLNLIPFIWVTETYAMGWDRMIEQLILNVLMFVPLGLLLPMLFQKMRKGIKTFLCVLGVTVSIEVFQYFTGRSADVDDVIMNCLGGLIGYGVFTMCQRLFADRKWWRNAVS